MLSKTNTFCYAKIIAKELMIMKWISTIEKIGKKAIDTKDQMIILFGEGANQDLEDVSVIQKFDADLSTSDSCFRCFRSK